MSIKVRYFASLKEYVGQSEKTLDVSGSLIAQDVWVSATADKPLPEHILVAINMEYADWDTIVNDGDEVAFFPPVTGGVR